MSASPVTPRAKRPWRELEDVERAHAKRMRPWTGIAPLGGLSVYGVPRLPTSPSRDELIGLAGEAMW